MADFQKLGLALVGAIVLPLLALIMDPLESARAAFRTMIVPLVILTAVYCTLRTIAPRLRRA